MSMSRLRIDDPSNLDKVWHLQQASLMDGLAKSDVSAVASLCTDRFFNRKEVIYERGEVATQLYILFRGCVRSSVGNQAGREKIVAFFKTGDVFGDNLLGAVETHRSRAVAHEECWVGTLSRHDFGLLIQQRPKLALNFIRILSKKLGDAREDIASLSFLGTQARLAKTLLKMGLRHGKPIVSHDTVRKLRFPLSHENLARLIGANRPHVSTIMSDFKKRGWIDYQGRKLLINMKELSGLAASLENGASTP